MREFILDDFMIVSNKKKDLFRKYQQFYSNKLDLNKCLELRASIEHLQLYKLEIELVIHNLNLFVFDKRLFYELISSLNHSDINDLNECIALKNILDSFELILLLRIFNAYT